MTPNLTTPQPANPAIAAMATSNTEPGQVSDPGLFAPLTQRELDVLCAHLRSGWYKQAVIYPVLALAWWETAALLDDMHVAWQAASPGQDAS
jgi:hypothetical protein